MHRNLAHSPTVVRTAVLIAAAFTLTACLDDPAGPPRGHGGPGEGEPTLPGSEFSVAARGGGAEPTHLRIAPGGGPIPLPSGGAGAQGQVRAEAIPDHYIVVFKDDVVNAEGLATDVAKTYGATVRYTYRAALKGFAAKLFGQAVEAIRRRPDVAWVEQDQVVRAIFTQDMDAQGNPWGLDRIDQRPLPLSHKYSYNKTGFGVRSYIIDTGLQDTHPEYMGPNGNRALNVYDAFGGDGSDCHGHGTHVGGTVGGKTYGVAKRTFLRGMRVLDCSGSGSWSGVIAALDWLRVNRIDPAVANMSLGGGFSAAVNTATKNLANSGVFVAVAAGNSSVDACGTSPASTPIAFTTAASDKSDGAAWFTNFGTCVDGYAPGVDIKSAWLGSGTAILSGTSMASPHVAGVAALYKQKFGNKPTGIISQWIKNNATLNVISGNPAGTPNRLLFKSTL